ncbi:N-acetylmuramoyl-L-alanine amidase [Aeromonas schubertii]|uniref:N-acetylmuramoyl-L-alanine amidase n=2 Tax=Aeromonas schubertii TaxID=652 RepID=A0A0S2SD60_9GAMM|nr:N-acetylmuramoyl-L-alanine amidase [Aeromonas schubertii]
MHYTALNFKESVTTLTGDSVSAHYLVPNPKEASYVAAGFKDMRIFNLVDENERAWHAGVSSWAGRSNLNDTAIGIEMVNMAYDTPQGIVFPSFEEAQIDAVTLLAADIIKRYPDITPTNVIGHSDISVGRKSDPGAAFPWKALYDAGVGAWYDEVTKTDYYNKFNMGLPSKADIIAKLSKYGYDTSGATAESGFKNLIRAFQLHFRPRSYTGAVDVETVAILYALVDKYFPSK